VRRREDVNSGLRFGVGLCNVLQTGRPNSSAADVYFSATTDIRQKVAVSVTVLEQYTSCPYRGLPQPDCGTCPWRASVTIDSNTLTHFT
jgi:hypothetical protein